MELYRSKYEAYPFLCDSSEDLRCDFELLSDEMASRTGLLISQVDDEQIKQQLLWICELIYHINPTLRTKLTVTPQETEKLLEITQNLKQECDKYCKLFVLPRGCQSACTAHILRVNGKQMVRMIYKWIEKGNTVENRLIDLANILSGYFFYLALKLNADNAVNEIDYKSRNYK